MIDFLVLLLALHFIADFIFQPKILIEMKTHEKFSNRLKGCAIHAFITLAISWISLYYLRDIFVVYAILAIALLHFIVDLLKPLIKKMFLEITNDNEKRTDLLTFIIDQIIHIIIIYSIYSELDYRLYLDNSNEISIDIAVPLILIVLVSTPLGYLISKILKVILHKENDNSSEILADDNKLKEVTPNNKYGFLIGILEREIILLGLFFNKIEIIIAVLGVKALLRFKSDVSREETEYFIIGNLLSILSVFALYVVINYIF